ncbi:hypothetical protein [Burkholderia alba]|uniref:hypothetical protein n=1 Tax=Burkholderia alba TaxID=2683677 RepID=UPI002B05CED4|nr:hypothetical protein [Burkholderia alba]
MLIRKQGRNIKLLRIEYVAGTLRAHHVVVGIFRADTGVPTPLLEELTLDERLTLLRWVTAHRENLVRVKAQLVLRQARRQLVTLIAALDVAADTLSPADADGIWIQLQAVAQALRRGGHLGTSHATVAPAPPPDQQDLVDEFVPTRPTK